MKKSTTKRPAFLFYPGDWSKDPKLQNCSVPAQGLWINMMCIMHECEPYGYLVVNGQMIQPAQLARRVGESEKTIKKWLDELENAGVFSRDEAGCIYSRRMVRDESLRNKQAEVGKAYGHLGAEHGVKGGRPKKEKRGLAIEQEPPLIPSIENEKNPPTPLIENQEETPSSYSVSVTDSVSNNLFNSVSSHKETGAADSAPSGKGKGVNELDRDELWAAGKSLLKQSGVPKAQCGSFVGKLCKDYGETVTLEAIRTAVVERPAEPVAYLKAVCQHQAGERSSGRNNGFGRLHSLQPENFDELDYGEGGFL